MCEKCYTTEIYDFNPSTQRAGAQAEPGSGKGKAVEGNLKTENLPTTEKLAELYSRKDGWLAN